jgi:uncharacterized membrane protein
MSFTLPVALVLLVAIPLIVYLGWPRLRYRRWRDAASLLLRVMIATLLILALAGAQAVRSADRLGVVFLMDVSDSVGQITQEAELNYIRQSLQSMGPDDLAGVVLFGANALVERRLSAVRELGPILSTPVTSNTDIEEAIRQGLAMFPAGVARRIVILTDGRPTVGDAESAAQLAAAIGVEISYVLFENPPIPEVQVSNVNVPSAVNAGQQFDLSFTVQAEAATDARITVLASGEMIHQEEVELQQGTNNYTLSLMSGGSGFKDFTVQVEPTGNDNFYQNNQLEAFSRVIGPPRILLVYPSGEGGEEEIRYLLPALQEAGLTVDTTESDGIPIGLAPLVQYDSIILANVPATQLSPQRMETLESYVRDLGGGLVVSGGPDTYGPGGYFQTPLEEMLPVEMQIRDQQRIPQLTIAYLIDTSGSMGMIGPSGVENIELAKEAIIRSIDFLQASDRAGVANFETAGTWVAQIQPVLDRVMLQELVAGLRAGGGTDIMAGLRLVARDIVNEPSERKHIILLTDGGADPTGLVELTADLYDNNDVTLSVIGIGAGAAPFLLDMAEAGGGNYHAVDVIEAIPTIFTLETVLATRSYILEESFVPTLTASSPIMNGITSAPPLLGYVATSPKLTAQVILRGPEPYNDPILASWQYGLGRSVAFMSDATARWATNWVAWDDFVRFWSQAVRWTITEGTSDNLETRVVMEGEQARLIVDARDAGGDFLNGLNLQMSLVDPELQSTMLPLQQVAPGRYEAVFTPGLEGAYLLHVAGTGADGETPVALEQTTGWVMSYSSEYDIQAEQTDAELFMNSLASLTGGRSLAEDPGAAFAHNLSAQATTTPIWPWLLLAALLLLPFDIAVRRLVITRTDVQRAWQAVFGRARAAAEGPSERLSTLMTAKERGRQRAEEAGEAATGTVGALRARRDQARAETAAQAAPPTAPVQDKPRYASRTAQRTPTTSNIAGELLKKRKGRGEGEDG